MASKRALLEATVEGRGEQIYLKSSLIDVEVQKRLIQMFNERG